MDAGEACAAYHDENVHGVPSKRIQRDEIWSFCYAKKKNESRAKSALECAGDVWAWTAIDPDNKMIVSWRVGSRATEIATDFIDDLQSRLAGSVQLTTDGHAPYEEAYKENLTTAGESA